MARTKTLDLSQLEELAILWPGDIRALAEFLLCASDARDHQTNRQSREVVQRSRPTLHGLARHFAMLTGVPESQITREFEAHGLNPVATVEFDSTTTETDRA